MGERGMRGRSGAVCVRVRVCACVCLWVGGCSNDDLYAGYDGYLRGMPLGTGGGHGWTCSLGRAVHFLLEKRKTSKRILKIQLLQEHRKKSSS